ncbi:MAG: hypothetical protein SGJ01_14420 [Gemmatimonadota bacterium]|nr:hypothetical protein [Gemmatimonadota bacterium]
MLRSPRHRILRVRPDSGAHVTRRFSGRGERHRRLGGALAEIIAGGLQPAVELGCLVEVKSRQQVAGIEIERPFPLAGP